MDKGSSDEESDQDVKMADEKDEEEDVEPKMDKGSSDEETDQDEKKAGETGEKDEEDEEPKMDKGSSVEESDQDEKEADEKDEEEDEEPKMDKGSSDEESDQDGNNPGPADIEDKDDNMDGGLNDDKKVKSSEDMKVGREAKKGEDTTAKKVKCPGRPSAAAAGFSTEGMTDKEVSKAVAKGLGNPYKRKGPAKKVEEEEMDDEEEEMDDEEEKMDDEEEEMNDAAGIASSDAESIDSTAPKHATTSSQSSTSSTSTSSSDSSCKPASEKGPSGTAEKAGFKIREEFPVTNIRRWMTPGSRFQKPPLLLKAKQSNRRNQIRIDDMWSSCSQGLISPNSSRTTGCQSQEEPCEDSKEKKGEIDGDDGQGETKKPELVVPTHRRRTKSFRHSLEHLHNLHNMI